MGAEHEERIGCECKCSGAQFDATVLPSLRRHNNSDSSSYNCTQSTIDNHRATCHECQIESYHNDTRNDQHQQLTTISRYTTKYKTNSCPPLVGFLNILFNLLIVNAILSHLNYQIIPGDVSRQFVSYAQTAALAFPRIMFAGAIECNLDSDCGSTREKICHENKCMCERTKPIEDNDRCLNLVLIGDRCELDQQCLGTSFCVEGICSCATDFISLYNPSTQTFYCHPKRKLNEECNHDSQCPSNSYCSSAKLGCLCHNGFAPGNVTNVYGNVTTECLQKSCTSTSTCESEFHQCEDNMCKCLATHFDPTTGRCYKFGSTGGKSLDELQDIGGEGNATSVVGDDNNFYSILKDLTENGDRLWLVLIILIILSILLLVLIFMLVRKHYLGYCWTAHKYEPNNESQPKNGYFNKNSINNKSFRQKNGEVDDDNNNNDDSSADRSNLVTSTDKTDRYTTRAKLMTPTDKHQGYVKVNINDTRDSFNDNRQHHQHHQQVTSPLKSSTSTPV